MQPALMLTNISINIALFRLMYFVDVLTLHGYSVVNVAVVQLLTVAGF